MTTTNYLSTTALPSSFSPPPKLFSSNFVVLFKPIPSPRHQQQKFRNGRCRSELSLSHDAPFAVAMGACVLNSLVTPVPSGPDDDDEGEAVINTADARFAVMGIISLIPYFNWMSWVFAWMDTMKPRYAVYAAVYLAPYFRSNFSLSPEDSWLPLASIITCIIHIQLEASMKNGDFQGFQLFNELSQKVLQKRDTNIRDELSNKIRGWGVPRKHSQDPKHLDGEEEKH